MGGLLFDTEGSCPQVMLLLQLEPTDMTFVLVPSFCTGIRLYAYCFLGVYDRRESRFDWYLPLRQ